MVEVPVPALQRGRVLVRTAASLISSGTERVAVESGAQEVWCRKRASVLTWCSAVMDKARKEGLLNTFSAVRDKLAASNALGYSAVRHCDRQSAKM